MSYIRMLFFNFIYWYTFKLVKAESEIFASDTFTCDFEPVNKTSVLLITQNGGISNDTDVVLGNNSATIVTCSPMRCRCLVYPEYKEDVKANYHQCANITVTVVNLHYDIISWRLKYKQVDKQLHEKMCQAQAYEPAQSVKCDYFCGDGIVIKCSAKGLYPEGKCSFVKNNFTSTAGQEKLEEKFTYTHSKSDKFFDTVCSTVLPYNYTNSSQFTITVYPNVTGEDSDIQHGVHDTFQINNDSSLIFDNCPENVTHGSNVTCTCKAVGCGIDDSSIRWINASDSMVMNNGSSTLHFLGHMGTQEFNCTANDTRNNIRLTKSFAVKVINSSAVNGKDDNTTQSFVNITQTGDLRTEIVSGNTQTSTIYVIVICVLVAFGVCLLFGALLIKTDILVTLCYIGKKRNEYHRLSNVSIESTHSIVVTDVTDNLDIYSLDRNSNDHYSTIRTSLIIINRKKQERCKQVQTDGNVTLQVRCEGSWLHEDPYAEISEVGTYQLNPVTDVDRNITIDTATSIGSDSYARVEDTSPSLMLFNETSLAAPAMCLPRETVNNCLYTQVYKRVA